MHFVAAEVTRLISIRRLQFKSEPSHVGCYDIGSNSRNTSSIIVFRPIRRRVFIETAADTRAAILAKVTEVPPEAET